MAAVTFVFSNYTLIYKYCLQTLDKYLFKSTSAYFFIFTAKTPNANNVKANITNEKSNNNNVSPTNPTTANFTTNANNTNAMANYYC